MRPKCLGWDKCQVYFNRAMDYDFVGIAKRRRKNEQRGDVAPIVEIIPTVFLQPTVLSTVGKAHKNMAASKKNF